MSDLQRELHARWPELALAPEALVALDALLAAEPRVEGENRADVLLAWAAAAGDAGALRALEVAAFEPAALRLRAQRVAADEIDDLLQSARLKLLVGDRDREPRWSRPGILAYRGRGPLAAFVQTVVVRLSVDRHRARHELPEAEVASLIEDTHPDPELEVMRARYAAALGEAIAAAWKRLPAHDVFVLRLELHQRLGVDDIARVDGVHRGTAVRKLASARAALVAGTRSALRQTLAIGDATLDSVLRVVTTSARWAALPAP